MEVDPEPRFRAFCEFFVQTAVAFFAAFASSAFKSLWRCRRISEMRYRSALRKYVTVIVKSSTKPCEGGSSSYSLYAAGTGRSGRSNQSGRRVPSGPGAGRVIASHSL